MLITETSTGTILIQSGDDAVELTRAEASRAAEQLTGYADDAGNGHWAVVTPGGTELAGPFTTQQAAEDQAEAFIAETMHGDSVSVAYVNA